MQQRRGSGAILWGMLEVLWDERRFLVHWRGRVHDHLRYLSQMIWYFNDCEILHELSDIVIL